MDVRHLVWAKDADMGGRASPSQLTHTRPAGGRSKTNIAPPPRGVGVGVAREARTSAALAAPGAGKGARRRLFG